MIRSRLIRTAAGPLTNHFSRHCRQALWTLRSRLARPLPDGRKVADWIPFRFGPIEFFAPSQDVQNCFKHRANRAWQACHDRSGQSLEAKAKAEAPPKITPRFLGTIKVELVTTNYKQRFGKFRFQRTIKLWKPAALAHRGKDINQILPFIVAPAACLHLRMRAPPG